MPLDEDVALIRRSLYSLAASLSPMLLPSVPPQMRVGEPNADGWIEWRPVPSPLGSDDVKLFQNRLNVTFPPMLEAYFLSCSHLFAQVWSHRHAQSVILPEMPIDNPTGPFAEYFWGCQDFLKASLLPIAAWGDAFGPVCLDSLRPDADGDYPVVWIDHGALPERDSTGAYSRAALVPLMQPLFPTYRAFLADVLVPH